MQDFSYLKPKLPVKWASILAEKHKLSEDAIRKIVNGNRKGPKYIIVVEDLIKLAENHSSKIKELHAKAHLV